MNDSFDIVPSGAALAAEIVGLDLALTIPETSVQKLRQALLDHCVLVFRGQSLCEADQIRFTRYFGAPAKHVRENPTGTETESEIFVVSNVKENGRAIGSLGHAEIDFHSDLSYLPKPGSISILYSLELPVSGSQTQWASAYAAYESLDDTVKARIAPLRAVHKHRNEAQNPPDPVDHPIVRRHPESGRLALYVTPYMTRSIVGLPSADSDELLQFLVAQVCRPEFVWTHSWQPGDLVMWDNRATSHRRLAFPESERRILKRTQVFGDEIPVGVT